MAATRWLIAACTIIFIVGMIVGITSVAKLADNDGNEHCRMTYSGLECAL